MRKAISLLSRHAIWVPAIAIVCLLCSLPGAAADDWPSISPEDLKMTNIAEQPGASAVILFRQEFYNDRDNKFWIYRRIKVLTEAGRKYADVELPYLRGRFKITEIKARTIHSDGTVIDFEGKPLDKIIFKAHGFKAHVKTFTLPDVQVGSILDIRYGWHFDDDYSLWQPDWQVQQDLFQKKVSFIYLPSSLAGHISWSAYLPKENLPQYGKDNRITLDMENVPALLPEPYMPPMSSLRWRVNFYYVYASSKEEYWKDKGETWNGIIESFLDKKKAIERVLPQVIVPTDTPEQKVRKIYAYITQLENRSYIPERAEKEERELKITENANVEDVLKQRSGDHDDLNLLFVAMVRGAGIPARLMLVPDRSQNIFSEGFLSFDQFDALVAVVQLNGKDVFLDPGTRFCPYGLLDWRYAAVEGLIEDGEHGAKLITTNPPSYKQAMIQRKATLTLADDGSATGTIAVGYFGLEAMQRRQFAALSDTAGTKKKLEDEIKSWLPPGSEVTLSKPPLWDETEKPLIAEFKISSPLAINAGKRRLMPLHIFETNNTNVFPSATRTQVIYFDYPFQTIDEVDVTTPAGVTVESLPQDDSVRLDYALYEAKQKIVSPGLIRSMRNIIMAGMIFPTGKYAEIKKFYDKVSTDDGEQVILKVAPHAEGN
jgi:hypothetical protein